ncbi:hypothetical protein LshimejAT787_0401920 [Lyophyllum shimeji]|uniref:RNA polymerase II elongation factor ELL N-terminal domain-containing protein n=1 Tax=Lyophyllum shimeji TaxID=47721 RepID=A0A9P3PKQ5_LYOSH|nr:hypothetical protein LshimejAT787_0401920 [Lyophyllum shimeji]
MPLPETTLALGPHTNPGESEHSKPKVAMLVRLSTEALDALQGLGEKPPIDFEFGDTSGIHIGGAFYPVRALKEETPHELYLRTHSASKPNAPLKLYANVTGKFTVEHDQLGANLKEKIREKTIDAAKQRDDRRTKFIDTPPTLPPKNMKKRKEPPSSSMFRNAVRPSDQALLNASTSSSAVPARVASPAPLPPKKKSSDPALRNRLIHCMAIQERPRDTIVRLVAGANCDASTRQEVLDLIEEVGEQTSVTKKGEAPGTKMWRLKTESWKEVRPFEWPKLLEQERINLARTGRQKLSSLGIKESDPLWEHFTFRAPAATTSAAPSAGPSRVTATGDAYQAVKTETVAKRGVTSKEVKEKKTKLKPDPNAEIQMKDESQAATRVKVEGASQATSRPAAARKPPGSGFRLGKSTTQDTPDASGRSAVAQGKAANAPRASLPAKPPPPTQQSSNNGRANGSSVPTQRIKKLRESDAGFGSDSDRERGANRLRDGTKSKVVVKQEEGEQRRRMEAPPLKRKQDGNESEATASAMAPPKKRKTESGAVATSPSSKDTKPKDLSLPKKPDLAPPAPRQKTRKDPSPPVQPLTIPNKVKKEVPDPRPLISGRDRRGSTSSSQAPSRGRTESSKPNGTSHKHRRRSPIYTSSSEDEGEIRRPNRETPTAPLPTPPMTGHHSRTQASAHRDAQARPTRARESQPRPLPTDHAALRAHYGATYNEYLGLFSKMVDQRTKIDSLLRRQGDSGSRSATDSDGDADDVELMDAEDLERLSLDYKRLYDELAMIREMFPEAAD